MKSDSSFGKRWLISYWKGIALRLKHLQNAQSPIESSEGLYLKGHFVIHGLTPPPIYCHQNRDCSAYQNPLPRSTNLKLFLFLVFLHFFFSFLLVLFCIVCLVFFFIPKKIENMCHFLISVGARPLLGLQYNTWYIVVYGDFCNTKMFITSKHIIRIIWNFRHKFILTHFYN